MNGCGAVAQVPIQCLPRASTACEGGTAGFLAGLCAIIGMEQSDDGPGHGGYHFRC